MTSARYVCHEHPDLFTFSARVIARRPSAVVLDRSAFYPGGGGQLCDRGMLRWGADGAQVTHIQYEDDVAWHCLDRECTPADVVAGEVDREFRFLMCQLHTDLHLLNAVVYQRFAGALVTGVQMAGDGTARIDFDLPEGDPTALRLVEREVNAAIGDGLDVREHYLAADAAASEPGVLRSRSVAPPPQPDGTIRVVEIVGLDRQACGGTHLHNTRESKPIRIVKIDNKGRHNRRIRIALVD